MKKNIDKTQLIKNYSSEIEKSLSNIYSAGYKGGYTKGKEETDRLRATCIREKGENDSEYAKKWRDNTPFYGWCSKCERPHSGRWAHVWEFCPWCGAKINHNAEAPYPTGIEKVPTATEISTNEDIEIGDELIDSHGRRCIAMRNTYYLGEDKEPFTLVWYGEHLSSTKISNLKKTGQCFPQIIEILEKLKKD